MTEVEIRDTIEVIQWALEETFYRRPEQAVHLARDLDCRGAPCPYPGKWYQGDQPEPAANLVRFITQYMPELWPGATKPDVQGIAPQQPTREPLASPLASPATGKSHVPPIDGWTVRQDRHGFYRAYRRIGGKVRAAYLGKSLKGAAEKIAAAHRKLANG